MRDIARALDMRQASLYYHMPEGKEQLFVEVMERTLSRHQAGLIHAIETAVPQLEAQLQAAVRWIFSQPPLYLFKMMENDMPALSAENHQHLLQRSHQALFAPLVAIFTAAHAHGTIRHNLTADHLAGTFLTILEGVAFAQRTGKTAQLPTHTADELIDILLNGLRPRAFELTHSACQSFAHTEG